ncbi:hypothetical protein ACLB2K_058147 [Fragaria x ananassa]
MDSGYRETPTVLSLSLSVSLVPPPPSTIFSEPWVAVVSVVFLLNVVNVNLLLNVVNVKLQIQACLLQIGQACHSVTDKLSSPWDYVRLSAVCKNWYTVAKHNQSKSSGLKGAPMLLIHQRGKCNDPWHLYDAFEEKVLSVKCDIPNYRYCGSCHGWLIAVEGKDLSVILVNPFMRVGKTSAKENSVIHLPIVEPPSEMRYPRASRDDYFVSTAIITADPLNVPTHEIVPVENGFLAVSDDALLSLNLSSNSVTQISTRFNPPDYEKKVYLVQLKDKSIIMVHRVLIDKVLQALPIDCGKELDPKEKSW